MVLNSSNNGNNVYVQVEKLINEMKLRGFTYKTQKSYSYHVQKFLKCGLGKREYLLRLVNSGKSSQSVRLCSAAIGFYENEILGIKSEYVSIPKKQSKLPCVLSKNQIISMINATDNEKHKIIVELLYSSGLRLQELVNLKYDHIDFDKNMIIVKQGKGQKDRVSIVSNRVLNRLDVLGEGYVLKGQNTGKYSKESVQQVLKKLAAKVGIKQKVTPHILRHSFATHLLENGTDIRYIQSLLGHARLETTQIYTRVAKNKLSGIKNPLD